MPPETERVTQSVSGDEKRQSAVTKNVTRLVVAPGWVVLSLSVSVSHRGTRGRTRSLRRVTWATAVRGPFGAVQRASGLAASPATALRHVRRTVWALSGGVGPCPDASDRTRTHPGTQGGAQSVVVDCAGVLWRVDALVSSASGARKAVRGAGLRASGPPRLSPDGTHWLCPVVRSSRAQLERLASQDRPPRRAGGPRLPPLATRWMPASGTVTLRRRAKHYVDPDDWPTDESATQEADLPPDDDGAWGQ